MIFARHAVIDTSSMASVMRLLAFALACSTGTPWAIKALTNSVLSTLSRWEFGSQYSRRSSSILSAKTGEPAAGHSVSVVGARSTNGW